MQASIENSKYAPFNGGLLFFENIDHQSATRIQSSSKPDISSSSNSSSSSSQTVKKKNVDEIEFAQPVKIQLIRIVRPNNEVHQNVKQLKTITEKDGQIKNFEIFARDLSQPSAKYTLILNAATISDSKTLTQDILVSLPQGVFTNQLVLRGEYNKITLCIYGDILSEYEITDLCPLYNTNFNLDQLPQKQKLIEVEEKKRKVIAETEVIQLKEAQKAQQIAENIFKRHEYEFITEGLHQLPQNRKKALHKKKEIDSTTGTATTNLSLESVNEIVQELASLYTEPSSEKDEIQQIEESKNKSIIARQKTEELIKLINQQFNESGISTNEIAHFENSSKSAETFEQIPFSVVHLCLNMMSSEMHIDLHKSLELALVLTNSEKHVNEFISNKGLEKIYSILRDGDCDSLERSQENNDDDEEEEVCRLPIDSSTKLKALELLNEILNYKHGADQFLNHCLEAGNAKTNESQQKQQQQDYDELEDEMNAEDAEQQGNQDDFDPEDPSNSKPENNNNNNEQDFGDNENPNNNYNEDDRAESGSEENQSHRKRNKRDSREKDRKKNKYRGYSDGSRSHSRKRGDNKRKSDSNRGDKRKRSRSSKKQKEDKQSRKDRSRTPKKDRSSDQSESLRSSKKNRSRSRSNNTATTTSYRGSHRDKQQQQRSSRSPTRGTTNRNKDERSPRGGKEQKNKSKKSSRSDYKASRDSRSRSFEEPAFSSSKKTSNRRSIESKNQNNSSGRSSTAASSIARSTSKSQIKYQQNHQDYSRKNDRSNSMKNTSRNEQQATKQQDELEKEELFRSKINKGYQIVLNSMTQQNNSSFNEGTLLGSRQVLHKSLMYFYLDKLSSVIQEDLLKELSFVDQSFQIETDYNSYILNLDKVSRVLSYNLTKFVEVLKEQTLINAYLSAGISFDEISSKCINADKKKNIHKFSSLFDVVSSNLYTLSNQQARFLTQMKLIPSILILLTNPQLKESKEFEQIFVVCYNLLQHLMSCRGSAVFFSMNNQAIKTLLQIFDQYEENMKKQVNQKLLHFTEEQNYSSSFSQISSIDAKILNNDTIITSALPINNQIIKLGILSSQLGTILKYFMQLINTFNQISQTIESSTKNNDINLLHLLTTLSTLSIKSSLSQIAISLILSNSFAMELLLSILQVTELNNLINSQVEITIISDFLYRALVFDSGVLTILYSNQIFVSVATINEIIRTNNSAFEGIRELRRCIILLINYMYPMEIFMDENKRGFNTLAAKLKKRSFFVEEEDKGIKSQIEKHYSMEKQISIKEFREGFLKYGNLDDPDQNLVFIDVSLKIFNLLITYNKNVFITCFESGLMSNLDHLSKQLTSLISFLTQKNFSTENFVSQLTQKTRMVNQYSSLLKKITHILTQRFYFKSGFQSKPTSSTNNNNSHQNPHHGKGPSHLMNSMHGQMMGISTQLSTNSSSSSNTSSSTQQPVNEKDFLIKYDSLFIEQIEMMMQLYISGYNFMQNSVDLNLVAVDKANWTSIYSNILVFFKIIFDFSPSTESSDNPASVTKYLQRIEKAFSSIQQQMINRIEDRPALLSLVTSIIALSKYTENEEAILNAIVKGYENEKLLELPLSLQSSLQETILYHCTSLSSSLLRNELKYFLKTILTSYDYNSASQVSNSLTKTISASTSILKEIILKQDKKGAAIADVSKLSDKIAYHLKFLEQMSQILSQCCSNCGFSNIFLYNHSDNELIRILSLLNTFEEWAKNKQLPSEIIPQIYSLRSTCLHVFGMLMDHEIGIGYLEGKLTNQDFNQNQNQNYAYLVEDIPQISHQQEFFEIIGSKPFEISTDIMSAIVSKKDSEVSEDYMEDESKNELSRNVSLESYFTCMRNILSVLQISSKNIVGQVFVLYKDYVGYAFKPNPSVKITGLTLQFLKQLLPQKSIKNPTVIKEVLTLLEAYLYLIIELTVHPLSQEVFASEKRKSAIKSMLIDDKQVRELIQPRESENNESGKQSESSRVLEYIFSSLQLGLQEFVSGFISLDYPSTSSPHSIDEIFEISQKCNIMLNYLKDYSQLSEEKSKPIHEKNPELPKDIRTPKQCYDLIHKLETKHQNNPKENNASINSITKFYDFFNKFTLTMLAYEDPQEIPRSLHLNSNKQNRLNNISDVYSLQASQLYHTLFASEIEAKLHNQHLWDADGLSQANSAFSTKSNTLIQRSSPFYRCMEKNEKEPLQTLLGNVTRNILSNQDQFDYQRTKSNYLQFDRFTPQSTIQSEVLSLVKKRTFKDSITNRIPIATHILETVKGVVKVKNPPINVQPLNLIPQAQLLPISQMPPGAAQLASMANMQGNPHVSLLNSSSQLASQVPPIVSTLPAINKMNPMPLMTPNNNTNNNHLHNNNNSNSNPMQQHYPRINNNNNNNNKMGNFMPNNSIPPHDRMTNMPPPNSMNPHMMSNQPLLPPQSSQLPQHVNYPPHQQQQQQQQQPPPILLPPLQTHQHGMMNHVPQQQQQQQIPPFQPPPIMNQGAPQQIPAAATGKPYQTQNPYPQNFQPQPDYLQNGSMMNTPDKNLNVKSDQQSMSVSKMQIGSNIPSGSNPTATTTTTTTATGTTSGTTTQTTPSTPIHHNHPLGFQPNYPGQPIQRTQSYPGAPPPSMQPPPPPPMRQSSMPYQSPYPPPQVPQSGGYPPSNYPKNPAAPPPYDMHAGRQNPPGGMYHPHPNGQPAMYQQGNHMAPPPLAPPMNPPPPPPPNMGQKTYQQPMPGPQQYQAPPPMQGGGYQGYAQPPPSQMPPPPPPQFLPQNTPQPGYPPPQMETPDLTAEEKRLFSEKLDEIKQLQKNKGDPRSIKRFQQIISENPKLVDFLNRARPTTSTAPPS